MFLLALGFATVCSCREAGLKTDQTRPALVFLVLDTVRADAIGPAATPAISALAEQSVVYSEARSPAPFTMPAMAAVMTGQYPHRSGVLGHSRRDRLSAATPVLAEIAHAAGYRTAAVVTNPWLANPQTGFARGFESYVSGRSLGRDRARLDASEVVDLGLRALDADDTRPLLLWLHFMDAHMPYTDGDVETAITRDFVKGVAARSRIYFEAPYPRAEIDATIGAYASAVRKIDDAVAALLARLPRDAIVFVLSDHGESLGEHGLFFAHDFTLYDELLRVVMIVRAPNRPAARFATPVSLLDVLPTVCELASFECPPSLDGEPLPHLAAPAREAGGAGRTLFAASAPARSRYDCPWIPVAGAQGRLTAAVRDGRKLIRIPTQSGAIEYRAFDLAADPSESVDRFDLVRDADLARALDEWSSRSATVAPAAPERFPAGLVRELRELGYLE